ncbi:glycosyltransferase family 39 protein [Caldifermentibacillus hisashii]|uniref:glycosyltransferase family 39 protein n=1 Tax=Caldifermentibacillus hisashii TaxID=996558 RepID=UPI0034D6CF4B
MKIYKGFSNFSVYAIYVIYGVMILGLMLYFLFDFRKGYYPVYTIGFLIFFFMSVLILYRISSILQQMSEKYILFGLILLCFIIKFCWIWFVRIEPLVDYATFFYTAVDLSQNEIIQNRYVALFPHIFGYSSFLSIFMKIFGASYMLPPILNVILSTISVTLIYFICKKIADQRIAIVASLLWIFFPSQTIYNMFALSEPLYTTVLLSIIALMIVIHEKLSDRLKTFGYSLVLAVLLAFMNMSRPIAAIPIIALAIWFFIIDIKHIGNKKIFVNKIIYLVTVIIAYSFLTTLSDHYISYRLGEEIATVPGYNIHVGFNMDSYGQWNQHDSDLLYYYNDMKELSANDVQRKMLEEAKNRIFHEDNNFFKLFCVKFLIFLGKDDAAVGYASSVLDHPLRLQILSDVYYYSLLLASLFGTFIVFKKRERSVVIVLCLYTIGLTMAQMLVEVSSRYHYSLTISFVVLASIGIIRLGDYIKLKFGKTYRKRL